MDEFHSQRVQNAYDAIVSSFVNEKLRRGVLTLLIRNGLINDQDWATCNKEAIELYIAEDEAKKRRQQEQDRLQKIYNEPDSKIPQLYRSINTQPERLRAYLETYDLKALEKYLEDLKARPLHYASLFPDKELNQAITFIEHALSKRRDEHTKTQSDVIDTLKTVGDGLKEVKKTTSQISEKLFGNTEQTKAYSR